MKYRGWLNSLHNQLYNRLGGLAVDIPSGKNTATPMVPLADIKKVLEEELGD